MQKEKDEAGGHMRSRAVHFFPVRMFVASAALLSALNMIMIKRRILRNISDFIKKTRISYEKEGPIIVASRVAPRQVTIKNMALGQQEVSRSD